MVYNLTSIAENSTGLLGLTQGVNDVLLFGWFGTLIIMAVCTILFISFIGATKGQESSVARSFAATMFIALALSLLFRAVELVPNKVLYVCLVGAAASVGFMFRKS